MGEQRHPLALQRARSAGVGEQAFDTKFMSYNWRETGHEAIAIVESGGPSGWASAQ